MSKTIKELRFNELYAIYKVLHTVDPKTAVERFSELFLERVTQCANELYEGDVDNVVMHKAIHNNLVSDKRTRFNNPETYFNGYLPERDMKLAMVELIDTLLPEDKRTTGRGVSMVETSEGLVRKAKWEYTVEDLQSITDEAELDSIRNNISSKLSRGLEHAASHWGITEDEARERLEAVRNAARSLKDSLKQPVISEGLAAKLQGGKHTTLSAAEVEELRRLLG